MREPFGKFKRKNGKGSDREHVPLAAIIRAYGVRRLRRISLCQQGPRAVARPTFLVVDDDGMSTVE
jgi:hypothetical protein